MGEKVEQTNITKKKGYLYFLDKEGDIACTPMARGRQGGGQQEKVATVGLKKETGYLYYLDSDGDVCRAPMRRGK